MIISGPLLVVLATCVSARLYITKREREYTLAFDESTKIEDIPFKHLLRSLHKNHLGEEHLAAMHFDAAESPAEVLRLSKEYFERYFGETQLIELMSNTRVNNLLDGKFIRRQPFENPDLAKEKLAIIQLKLGLLNAENLGERINEVIERIPNRLRRLLPPCTALLSKFKFTAQELARLFYIGKGAFEALKPETRQLVDDVMNQIAALKNGPNRIFAAGRLIQDFVKRTPELGQHFLARIEQFLSEITYIRSQFMSKSSKAKVLGAKAAGLPAAKMTLPPAPVLLFMAVVDKVDTNLQRIPTILNKTLTKLSKYDTSKPTQALDKANKLISNMLMQIVSPIKYLFEKCQAALDDLFHGTLSPLEQQIKDILLRLQSHALSMLGLVNSATSTQAVPISKSAISLDKLISVARLLKANLPTIVQEISSIIESFKSFVKQWKHGAAASHKKEMKSLAKSKSNQVSTAAAAADKLWFDTKAKPKTSALQPKRVKTVSLGKDIKSSKKHSKNKKTSKKSKRSKSKKSKRSKSKKSKHSKGKSTFFN